MSGRFIRCMDVVIFTLHLLVLGACWLVSPAFRLWYGWKDRQWRR